MHTMTNDTFWEDKLKEEKVIKRLEFWKRALKEDADDDQNSFRLYQVRKNELILKGLEYERTASLHSA